MKILFRLLTLPFVASIILLAAIRNYIYTLYLWIRGGGELITHDDAFNPATHRDQFIQIQELLKAAKNSPKAINP